MPRMSSAPTRVGLKESAQITRGTTTIVRCVIMLDLLWLMWPGCFRLPCSRDIVASTNRHGHWIRRRTLRRTVAYNAHGPRWTMPQPTIAFLCYDRHDDRDRSVSSFREALTEALTSKATRPREIFQDRINIRWGENWRDRIRETLDEIPLLVPVVTPNFLQSHECRDELECFLEAEDRRRRWDLILPVYFYPIRQIDDD